MSSYLVRSSLVAVTLVLLVPVNLLAENVLVAVATNFLNPMKEIAFHFEAKSGHRVTISAGSTGKLFAQIQHGAPFEVFLSADSQRPQQLEEQGQGIKGTRFVYAIGRIVLWSRGQVLLIHNVAPVLQEIPFNHMALANPKTAPYGRAAVQTLRNLKTWEFVKNRIVQGENIGQAFQYVASGNAELGFVAFSQVLNLNQNDRGSWWEVPAHLHDAIAQSAVLLQQGRNNPAARALLEFLKTSQGKQIIEKYGYRSEGLD